MSNAIVRRRIKINATLINIGGEIKHFRSPTPAKIDFIVIIGNHRYIVDKVFYSKGYLYALCGNMLYKECNGCLVPYINGVSAVVSLDTLSVYTEIDRYEIDGARITSFFADY